MLWQSSNSFHTLSREETDRVSSWLRIGDDELLHVGYRELRFAFAKGEYTIVWDPTSQHCVTVLHEGSKETWSVSLREVYGSRARLSGSADWAPEILEEVCWFELVLGDQATITYWGDKVIYRVDSLSENEAH
jgi:hypothetical protein